MRTAGAVMIGAACAYMGFMKGIELKKRCDILSAFISALEMLETEIGFNRTELKKAFYSIDKAFNINGFFKTAADKTERQGIRRAWNEAVDEKLGALPDADRSTVKMLSLKLGMTDAEEQIKQIRYIKKILDGQLKAAETDNKRLGRLYRSGGALIGAFIVLVLI